MKAMHSTESELDLNLLFVLDALFKEGSVTRAAEGIGMTQSAASHALNRLRDFFDDPLFVRTGSQMAPTRKAESMRQAVSDVVAAIRQQILSGAHFEPRLARRTFTLCMTDMGELVFLPALLQRLKKEAPGCTVRTLQVPAEQIPGVLASGDADLAVGSIRSAPEGLYQQRLFLHSFVTIVSARNREVGETLTRELFERLPHVVVSLTGRTSEAYDRMVEEQGVQRTAAVVTPHFLMVPLLMERDPRLIATVPLELANVFGRFRIVRAFEPPVPMPRIELRQHWHPRFHHDPAVIWLRDLMKQTFENYPDIVLGGPPTERRARLSSRARSRKG